MNRITTHMMQSMTGFGQSSCELEDKFLTIEIKSLNSKQFDLYLRMPNLYRDKEMEVRNELNNRLKRGKIDVGFYTEYKEDKVPAQINAGVVKNYYLQIKEILEQLDIKDPEPVFQAILRLPESLLNGKQTVDPAEWAMVMETLISASDAVNTYRKQEGEAIEKDIRMRIELIESYLEQIEPFEKERLDQHKKKLHTALLGAVPHEKIDQNRLEQELIYYFEKTDITEEKIRLTHHCKYFTEVISENEQVGRKLGFVAQEIGREINTIGSKANHADIQKLVVLMKDELEKIKEQILNVL